MENYSVGGLGFSISLRMGDGGESMLNVELGQELLEPPIVELSIIVCNDHSRETILVYYGFSDERLSLGFGDVGHWLGLYLFSEIIYCDEEEFSLQGSFRERSQYINSPLFKRPRRDQSGQLDGMQMLS